MKAAVRTLAVVSIAALAAVALIPYWRATALILRAAGTGGTLGAISRWEARPVSDTIERIPVRGGSIRVRVFRPGRRGPPIGTPRERRSPRRRG